MNRIGLALSGGGFRATLYHLGVVRFLRDADLLPKVSHITSVSGGSIFAAHLVMNWDRYTGSDSDYDEAAREILDFVKLDVRNRVVRRFPLALVANGIRWACWQGRSRRLTRPGLLERHYEKYLFGDKCLYELPAIPQLHILATNVNEGCLCSFTRSGLLLQRRLPGGSTRFDLVPSALATVPMAVTASSAFPGFFPPLQLNASDVGADESRFPTHLFTDGGVFDNLGVRMFRHIRESWIGHDTPLRTEDFVDLPLAVASFQEAERSSDASSPLHRLASFIRSKQGDAGQATGSLSQPDLPHCLWNLMMHCKLYCEPAFDSITPAEQEVAELCGLARQGRELDRGDHLLVNRHLVDAAYQSVVGQPLFQSSRTKFDAVIVSDAGKLFSVSRRSRGGGLLGMAMRSSDILMNRVWQLENDYFSSRSDFVFAPMSMTVALEEDPTALHPELQNQVTSTRTDMDRFSDLEISGLIRHGYGVMRKVCRSRTDLFRIEVPNHVPWDPIDLQNDAASRTISDRETSAVTQQARALQASSNRRVFSRLLSVRDWPTYVFLPFLLLLLIGIPVVSYKAYRTAHRTEMLVDAITNSNPDFSLVLQLARQNPIPGDWVGIEVDEVAELQPSNTSEFELITDTRIFDLRAYEPGSSELDDRAVHYRRMRVRRLPDASQLEPSPEETGHYRIHDDLLFAAGSFEVRCDAPELAPAFSFMQQTDPEGKERQIGEMEFDLSSVPMGDHFDIGFEIITSGVQGDLGNNPKIVFPIVGQTNVASMWILLPTDRPISGLELLVYESDSRARLDTFEPTYQFNMEDGSLFGWMMVAPRANHTYECRWSWQD